jgi:hypothetical protein
MGSPSNNQAEPQQVTIFQLCLYSVGIIQHPLNTALIQIDVGGLVGLAVKDALCVNMLAEFSAIFFYDLFNKVLYRCSCRDGKGLLFLIGNAQHSGKIFTGYGGHCFYLPEYDVKC